MPPAILTHDQHGMQLKETISGLQYCGLQLAPRYTCGVEDRDIILGEDDSGSGGYSRRTLHSRSTQAPLVALEGGPAEAPHHSESLPVSNMTALKYRCNSMPERRGAAPAGPVNDKQDTSDSSELSDISGLSEYEEEEDILTMPNARKEEVARDCEHRINADRAPCFQSPKSEHSPSIKPKCKQDGFIPPVSPSTEQFAVKHLLQYHTRIRTKIRSRQSPASFISPNDDDFTEFELSEFSIYLPDNKFQPFSMKGLQHLGTRSSNIIYMFDGILSLGAARYYVQDIPFTVRSIGNYGEDLHEVGSQIWIESEMNTGTNIFYRLGHPSAEYARFHDEFLWLADFAKHFVDYLEASERPVSLHRFRADFYQWLRETHSMSSAFQAWYRKYNKEDFRCQVSVNIAFLFSESIGINQELKAHPVWSECMSREAVPLQELEEEQTIVTEYVYECFKDIRFGQYLKLLPSRSGSEQTALKNVCLTGVPIRNRSVAEGFSVERSNSLPVARKQLIQDIKMRSADGKSRMIVDHLILLAPK
ncbi:DNA methyltransferase Dim-2 [Cadophora gregata f. sp. sojae]|nr:DNA methyltransferase Dim-2 [Cadophora gregata f. sp. sojae]